MVLARRVFTSGHDCRAIESCEELRSALETDGLLPARLLAQYLLHAEAEQAQRLHRPPNWRGPCGGSDRGCLGTRHDRAGAHRNWLDLIRAHRAERPGASAGRASRPGRLTRPQALLGSR
eukprot:3255932-Prymnesium_polylepis.2